MVQALVGPLLLQRQLLAAWLLRWHKDLHLGQRERQKAQILQQPTPRRQGIGRRLGEALVVYTSSSSLTEKEDRQRRIDEQDIFHCVVLFLAAITRRLCSRVLGADDPVVRCRHGQKGGRLPS